MDYPTINPYNQILPGIQTGMQLAGMFQKNPKPPDNPNAMNDPGEYKVPTIGDALKDVQEDLNKYATLTNHKLFKKLDVVGKNAVLMKYSDAGVFKTDIGKSIAKNPNLSVEDITDVFDAVKNGTPESPGKLEMLRQAAGNDPELNKAIDTRMQEYDNLVNQSKESRKVELVETLDRIDKYNEEGGKNWTDKFGQLNPQTKAVVDNWKKYLAELATLDPDLANRWLEDKRSKRSGGGSSTWMSTVDNKTGENITLRVANENEFLAKAIEKGFSPDMTKLALTPKQNEFASTDKQAEIKIKKYKEAIKNLPASSKEGYKLRPDKNSQDAKIVQQFIDTAKKFDPENYQNTARKMAKDKGWAF